MKIREMQLEDIAALRLDAEWMRERYKTYLECQTGPAWVMEDKGGLLCAFGAAFLWDGVCEVWFNLIRRQETGDRRQNKIALVRAVKRHIDEQCEALNIRRMHATVKCSSGVGMRFVEALGFEVEGRLKQYNPDGSDAYMYARVKSHKSQVTSHKIEEE